LEETTLNIEEDFPTKPYLTYAQTKNQNEIDIKENSDNYIILRLGSVYGYSSDTMRMNIMPNLFSKITSQDGQITLFSGGDNHKSLVSVLDVVDAMRFFGEGSFTNETYHLTDENLTVKEVSRICKNVNPKVSIVETMSEISLGYSPKIQESWQKTVF
jgi:nucleoside-diphosphate-sugar epimerase